MLLIHSRNQHFTVLHLKKRQSNKCRCGTGEKCYSRPALLTGMPVWNADLEAFVSLVHLLLETSVWSLPYHIQVMMHVTLILFNQAINAIATVYLCMQ